MPKLSILLPTYNGEAFLAEQIDSILSQTDPDFELIAIDDGSTDGTAAALARFAAQDRRITIVPSQGNRGQNGRLVELLDHARGDFIAIADQDDRWAPDRNARLLAALGDRQIVFARSELIDAQGQPRGQSLLESFGAAYSERDRLRALIEPMFSAHAMLMRRAAIGAEAFSHRLPFDWLIALEAAFGGGLDYCDDAVVHHRLHAGNQHNTFHQGHASSGVLTRSSLGLILMFRTPARLKQLQLFDYLGRSRRIERSLQRTFMALADRCHAVWFSEWRALRSDGGLRDQIMDALAPLAGSAADLERFEKHVAVLTGSLISRPVRSEIRWRYHWVGGGLERTPQTS